MAQSNSALLELMLWTERKLEARAMGYHPLEQPPIEHIDFESLPISEYTGLPYDPELACQLIPSEPRNPLLNRLSNPNLDITIRKSYPAYDLDVTLYKRKSSLLSKLFRRRAKPQPKQDHPSEFEIAEDGPYAGCERCHSFLEILSEEQVEVFYEKEKGHRHLFQRGDTAIVDKRLISEG